ncbi:hypothetical protein AOCH_002983 [Aspergillus ochraceoroseus]|uniref:Integral membrane bound transporter domain-containing protein n=1 Tax=Aspergillus ochraceoroseus TaxID=138278 RepID=A0A0F8UQR5_9EURO|nr:hypothetical protein AOCH_002983 [Aspergillus ochraceoroseus]
MMHFLKWLCFPLLRQATFILPKTGQRLKGLVHLRNSQVEPNGHGDNEERRGLLSGELPPSPEGITSRVKGRLFEQVRWLRQFLTSELGIGVLKCSLAYLLGSLATFVPAIAAFLGQQDGKHMVATITDTLHMLPLGHAVVLIVFCGGGLGFIGWTKQRLGDPLVNVACSLASLSTITVLTKEGAVQSGDLSFVKISQVLKMILLGVTATMAVSFLIFPISARKKLRANLTTTTETLATMLALITESFLSGSEEELQTAEFLDAAARHKKAYAQLDSLVKEAKLEHLVRGTEKEYRLEKNLARWVQDITHNMGGLRSAALLQFQLLKQTKPTSSGQMHTPDNFTHGADHGAATSESDAHIPLLPADMFALFIDHLGPSMRSLAFTLKEIFREIPFTPAPHYKVSIDSRFRISLDRALALYQESREQALKAIYHQKDILNIQTLEVEADLEEVAASCGHFSFSLLEFGEQLKQLLAILDELQLEAEERPNGRSWNWLKFWRKGPSEQGKKVSGASCAILSWYATAGNVFGLAFLGLFMATWTSYLIIVKRQGPMGRFIMLTYNLSVLYAYSLTQKDGKDDQDEGGDKPIITEIALHRVVAVLSGCIWGIIITRLIWPISARARLKDGLSLLWLRLGLIWKCGPLSATHSFKQPTEFMSAREKLEVERFLSNLESLQASARSEFELKHAFSDDSYTNLLTRTRSMVNSFVAMHLELVKNMTASEGELAILEYTIQERRQLSARISHLLSFMASSMKLEYPLSDGLPSVENARDRLLARLFHYRKDPEASQLSTDEDYALLYAYVLVTGQLSTEIEGIVDEIGRLFGVLNEDAVKLYP